MARHQFSLAWLVLLGLSSSYSAILKYPECIRKYPVDSGWDASLQKHWTEWKIRFMGSDGVIKATDPSGTSSNVSEAQSYGMLLAVWFNDQSAFNKILDAANTKFWNTGCGGGGWYGWKLPGAKSGCTGEGGFASNADLDIAGALIFASALQDKKHWSGTNYKTLAVDRVTSVWNNMVDKSNYRMTSWSGSDDNIRNPSYHMPAWGQVFQEFAEDNGVTGQDWGKVRSAAYALMNAQPNAKYGMARNFCNGAGGTPGSGTSSGPGNPDNNTSRTNMGFDAIRVPYRMGLDAMWYPKHTEAVKWCKSVWDNAATSGTGTGVYPDMPGMYFVETGKLWGYGTYPAYDDSEYEKSLTGAMWGTAAIAVRDSSAKSGAAAATLKTFIATRLKAYPYFSTYASEDVANNYYAQTLALMGALAMSGRAPNIWDDLMNPWIPPEIVTTKFIAPLTAAPTSVVLVPAGTAPTDENKTRVTATLSRSETWRLQIKSRTSGAIFDTTGTGTAIDFYWSSNKKAIMPLAKFDAEQVDVRFSFADMDSTLAASKATITLTKLSSTQTAMRPAIWTTGGLRIDQALWKEGDRVMARIFDPSGRPLAPCFSTRIGVEGKHLVLPRAFAPSSTLRILEFTNIETGSTDRYVIPPTF
ncbi:MAG: hypothetical protein IPN71_07900 [Fibrobacteres bacterium]|nr:hypothetical protein [Fibrobacterota bacterium]